MFERLKSFDFDRVCPTTLKYKPERMKYSKVSNTLIANYNHYSWVFGKVINITNHFHYLFLLVL